MGPGSSTGSIRISNYDLILRVLINTGKQRNSAIVQWCMTLYRVESIRAVSMNKGIVS